MKEKIETEWAFWTTILISFVLLVHNGTEPLFLIALALLPILILLFRIDNKKGIYALILCLLITGILGRYTRYFRENYASDTLPAIRDFIGYFVHGYNVYEKMIMAQNGLTPFTYLPFSIFWYLPAYILKIDLRFFEMIVSCFVPLTVLVYGKFTKIYKILPFFAIVSITPFLLDLSSDGSNDNSSILFILVSAVFFVLALKKKSRASAITSAISLGLAISFKHYAFFYLLFFVPYMLKNKKILPISSKKYLLWTFITAGVISLPFIIASSSGFARSFVFIEIANRHKTWGWNVWVALRDLFGINLSVFQMWLIRTLITGTVALYFLLRLKLKKFNEVFIACSLTMFFYIMWNQWTTYAYFTFLIPLLGLGAYEVEQQNS